MKHKHADLIIAWANGAQIQVKFECSDEWANTEFPSWHKNHNYRIKPESSPDFVQYICFDLDNGATVYRSIPFDGANLKLIFDGETGQLKLAKVIK